MSPKPMPNVVRQAEEEIESLRAERDLYHRQWKRRERELDESRADNVQLRVRITELESLRDQQDAQLAQLRADEMSLREALKDLAQVAAQLVNSAEVANPTRYIVRRTHVAAFAAVLHSASKALVASPERTISPKAT